MKIKIIGIRKDGVFIYEDDCGEKKILPKSQEKDFILYNPSNEHYKIEISNIDERMKLLSKEKTESLAKVTGVSLVDYKSKYIRNKG